MRTTSDEKLWHMYCKRLYGEKCVLQAVYGEKMCTTSDCRRNCGMCATSSCIETNVYYKRLYWDKCVLQATVLRQMCTTSDCIENNVHCKRLYGDKRVLNATVRTKKCVHYKRLYIIYNIYNNKTCTTSAAVRREKKYVLQAAVWR